MEQYNFPGAGAAGTGIRADRADLFGYVRLYRLCRTGGLGSCLLNNRRTAYQHAVRMDKAERKPGRTTEEGLYSSIELPDDSV